jgi:hypothetical protein
MFTSEFFHSPQARRQIVFSIIILKKVFSVIKKKDVTKRFKDVTNYMMMKIACTLGSLVFQIVQKELSHFQA